MLISVIRTVIIYLVLLFMLRIMGKRQIGNMQPHELVITITIAELGVVSMENTEIPLLAVILPVMVLFLLQFVLSWLTCRSQRMNALINGRPLLVVYRGRFQTKTMRDALISTDEILEQMRLSGVKDVRDVSCAILETTGQLSVFVREAEEPPSAGALGLQVKTTDPPVTVIQSGRWQWEQIQKAGLSRKKLEQKLRDQGYEDISGIYYAQVHDDGSLYIQPKGDKG